jgi:hypothetical protein
VFAVVHEQFLDRERAARRRRAAGDDVPRARRSLSQLRPPTLAAFAQGVRAAAGPALQRGSVRAIAKALGLPRETWDVTPEGLVDELVSASMGGSGPRTAPRSNVAKG